jgi:hypothetical protein
MRIPGYSEQPVVALGLAFGLFLDLKNANDAAREEDAREGRCRAKLPAPKSSRQ